MQGKPVLHPLPCATDPAQAVAEYLLQHHADRLPDLSDILLLAPVELHGDLRRSLLQAAAAAGSPALLVPRIASLSQWLRDQLHQVEERPTVSPYRRELILIRELRAAPQLYGSGSPWQLCTQLLQLFDELSLNERPPEPEFGDFLRSLGDAYAVPVPAAGLEAEARLVHTLWCAWQDHQQQHRLQDATGQYLQRLSASLQPGAMPALVCMVGEPANLAEQDWLLKLAAEHEVHVFRQLRGLDESMLPAGSRLLLHSSTCMDTGGEDSLTDRFCNELYCLSEQPLPQRAQRWRDAGPAPGRLPEIVRTRDSEQLAQAITDQCGDWLARGISDIGIVSEDRKLARRLRALLERHRIPVRDLAGWALSTTRSAAVLERWLQTIEEDFFHRPLLDLLKSPALQLSDDRDTLLHIVYRFEHEIVRFSNIARGLTHYRRTLQHPERQGLRELRTSDGLGVEALLDRLQQAGEQLQPFCSGGRHAGVQLIDALYRSLDLLGMLQGFRNDEAGARILQELELMRLAAGDEDFTLDWMEFRAWLGYTLERYNFTPPGGGDAPVTLMSLGQSDHRHCQALIIAGAEARWLPGRESQFPFFNDRVRRALGLSGIDDQYRRSLYLFRRLLSAAPHIMIGLREQENGEDLLPCPWLELLESAARLAWETRLQVPTFAQPAEANPAAADLEPPAAPILAAPLVPEVLSATDLQMLMDCPYRFFAARGLQLRTPEVVTEELEKSDYGARVHRCLQAFHSGIRGLPGPFDGAVTEQRRIEAQQLLEKISQRVFFYDLEDNFVHRAWYARWQRIIPDYIGWQCEQASRATFYRAEAPCLVPDPSTGIAAKGRIDRVDKNDDGLQIIDYKTGTLPRRRDIDSGEALQLPFYALLAEQQEQQPVSRVLYLGLTPDGVESAGIDGDALDDLKTQVQGCLDDTRADLRRGSAMPAWGDEQSCRWCEFGGLCRKSLQQGEQTHG